MKKFISIISIISIPIIIFLVFLFKISVYPQNEKRPCDYPNTHWVSENPNAYFDVIKSDISDNYHCKGRLLNSNGEYVNFELKFDNANGVEIWYGYSNMLLRGHIPNYLLRTYLSGEKMVITNIEYDTIFNNKYNQIVFYRQKK